MTRSFALLALLLCFATAYALPKTRGNIEAMALLNAADIDLSRSLDLAYDPIAFPTDADGEGGWIKAVSDAVNKMIEENLIDINVIVDLSTQILGKMEQVKAAPAQIWTEVQNIIDYTSSAMTKSGFDDLKTAQVRQVLYDSLSIVASKYAGFPGLPLGCWLGQTFRLGDLPNVCQDGLQLNGFRCHRPCDEGFFGIGPLCIRGLRMQFRGWGAGASCSEDLFPSMGFCYKEQCSEKYPMDKGPFCLATECPVFAPVKCGRLCVTSERDCSDTVARLAKDGQQALVSLQSNDSLNAFSNGASIARTIVNYQQCPDTESINKY